MLYSFMYELPKSNHKYGLSGIRLKVDAEHHEDDTIYIECEKLLVSNVINHEEAHRQMILQTREIIAKSRKPSTKAERQALGGMVVNEIFEKANTMSYIDQRVNQLWLLIGIVLAFIIIFTRIQFEQ